MPSFLDELKWRGQLHQTAGAIDLHLATLGRVGYAGFDPTSDSLTIGNFVPVKLLMHWQQAGHQPIVLMGGGTGLIGDPSGREAERSLMTRDEVEANVASQKRIMERLIDFSPRLSNRAVLLNNIDWLGALGFIEVLRDVGKHFSVNEMIQRDSVKRRLEQREHGISYTEFSYMILQACDFLHLRRERNCTVQMGGADQFGNIIAGMDLIRREFAGSPAEGQAYGVTAPLVARSDGRKMSKSTGQAIWLSSDTRDRTSPWAFYQYWINLPDADVIQWLKWYTMLDRERIESIEQQHAAAPEKRAAQHALADEMTRLIHGETELRHVQAAASVLFAGGELRSLSLAMLEEIFADVPHTVHDRASLEGPGVALVDLLPQTSLASSKREAREFLAAGAVQVNGERAAPPGSATGSGAGAGAERSLTTADLLHGSMILLKRGKKLYHATRWQ
jgi:tyrosyl-tRNA synthetase